MQVQLKVVNGKQAGQLISINRPKFMIGRAEDCQLKSKNELISRYHCILLTEEGYVGVRDLNSRNGVFVNGEKIDEETELRNGDRLAIGPLEFEVVVKVAMSAGKKPKVESISEVVARTVEQSSLSSKSSSEENGDVSDWLLSDSSDESDPGERTIEMKAPTGSMKRAGAELEETVVDAEPEPEPEPIPQPKAVRPAPKPEVKKPAAEKPKEKPIPKTPPATPGQTANNLMNFFKNR